MAIVQTDSMVWTAASASTASVTHGLTINSGDVVVAFIYRNTSTTAISLQGAAGGGNWVEDAQQDGSDTSRLSVQYVVANGTEPDIYTWGLNTTDRVSVLLRVFSGVDNTTPIDVTSAITVTAGGSTTSCVAQTITVTEGAAGIVFYGADKDNAFTFAAPDNSYTDNLTLGPYQRIGGAYRVHASAGATGTVTSIQGDTRDYTSVHLSLRPGGGITDVNLHGTGRGILRGIGRGIG